MASLTVRIATTAYRTLQALAEQTGSSMQSVLEKAIEDYQKALETIAGTHKKLDEEREHWNAKRLSKDLGPAIVSLGNAAVSVNKAF